MATPKTDPATNAHQGILTCPPIIWGRNTRTTTSPMTTPASWLAMRKPDSRSGARLRGFTMSLPFVRLSKLSLLDRVRDCQGNAVKRADGSRTFVPLTEPSPRRRPDLSGKDPSSPRHHLAPIEPGYTTYCEENGAQRDEECPNSPEICQLSDSKRDLHRADDWESTSGYLQRCLGHVVTNTVAHPCLWSRVRGGGQHDDIDFHLS